MQATRWIPAVALGLATLVLWPAPISAQAPPPPPPAPATQGPAGIIKPAPTQFINVPGAPDCLTAAVQDGDPSKGPSVMVLKGTAGCAVPWHYHTPNEQVMMLSGTARVQMKDEKPVSIRPGAYAFAASRHTHQFACVSACTVFLSSDGPFDIHYVDAAGNEIPPAQALKARKTSGAS